MPTKKILLTAIISAVALVGCTQNQAPTSDTAPAGDTQNTVGSETGDAMTEDDAMMEDDAMEEDGDAMMEDDAMMDDEAMMEGNTEYTIEMSNFEYSVESITASPGETLTINLVNVEGQHDFDIDELGVDTEVTSSGDENTVTVEIPADAEPGTEYAYYCSVGNHRALGMEGTITVQ